MNFTMGLFEEIINAADHPSGSKCGVSTVLTQMAPADASDLRKAMADRSIFGTTISGVLKTRNLAVSGYTIQRHRRQICSCADPLPDETA